MGQLPVALGCVPALLSAACSQVPVEEPEIWSEPIQGWVQVWRDDFSGPAQSAPDPAHWNVEKHEHGLNHELDYDTDDRKNSFVDGQGNLVLQAIREQYIDESGVQSSQPFTSARLNTQALFEQQYGRFEARIKLPVGGQGVWPAFWMLGNDITQAGWPDCGEVDILEMRGSSPSSIVSSLHASGYYGGNSLHQSFDLTAGKFGDDFHTFTFEWTPDAVRWLLDGEQYFVKTRRAVEDRGHVWAFDHPFFLILNLAVGGIFDGDPPASTAFPQQMQIDYVSVARLGP